MSNCKWYFAYLYVVIAQVQVDVSQNLGVVAAKFPPNRN